MNDMSPANIPTPPQTPPPAHSQELLGVFDVYMQEHKLGEAFAHELLAVFPNDQAFLNVKQALGEALMPGDRASILPKSINHLTILVGVSMARTARKAVADAKILAAKEAPVTQG